MPTLIMIIYYVITAFIAGLMVFNFIKERENKHMMLLYLIVLIPFVLRLLRIR